MTITATINNVTVPVMPPLPIDRRINLRTTVDLIIIDLTASLSIAENMPVVVTDSVLGQLFTGYVDKIGLTKVDGSGVALFRSITCKDQRWLADKRYFTAADYTTPRLAGDLVCDLHTLYLSAEGVVSAYAQRYDKDATTWGQGTLTGVSGATGVLQLASAGSTVTTIETTTANFATGTLTNVAATNNQLQLASYTALKFIGSAAQGIGSNLYHYRSIWSGSYTIVAGDTLMYDLFISTTSPQLNGGIDLGFSDGSNLRDKGYTDSLGIGVHPGTTTAQYASDMWYARSILLSPTTNPLTGKIINTCMIALEGDTNGTYTLYAKNIRIMNGATTKVTFFSSTLTRNVGVNNAGYYNTNLSVVTAYASTGSRVSPAYSIAAASIARGSLISWTQTTQTQQSVSSTQSKLPQVLLETSIDGGATWQTALQSQAIAALSPGKTLTGVTLTLRETLALGGPNPELTPSIQDVTATVLPSYSATKSDVTRTEQNATDFGTGTLTNVTASASGLQITGNFRDWSSGDVNNCTKWDTNGFGTMNTTSGALSLRMDSNFSPPNSNSWDIKAQFNFAGNWTNFIAEMDIQYVGDPGCQYGMVYRTTFWGSGNNTYGYLVYLDVGGVHFARGTNSSPGTFFLLGTTALTFNAGEWYHLKVQANGSTHTCWLNDVFMYSITDATFSAAGGFGARLYNNDTTNNARHSGFYNNFGVQSSAFTGNRVSSALSLAAASIVGSSRIDWVASVPDTTSLLIESSINGGSTYQTCTNGATIPGLTPGVNVASTSLQIRETLTTQNANATPTLSSLTTTVVGQYNVSSAQRISPVLSLGTVGTCGATSVTWNAVTPAGTTVLVDTSPDGSTWTNIAASGNPIAGLITSPDPIIDDFLVNSSANYTQSGGTFTWDTANSRLVGITNGLLVNTAQNYIDGTVVAIMDYADNAGLLARYTSASNYYSIFVHDGSASFPNTLSLNKLVAGVSTQLASGAISFPRGTYHTLTLSIVGSSLSVLFDGTVVASATDAALAGAGKWGVQSGTKGQWYTLWLMPQGQSLAGKNAYSRVRMTSTDPTVTPQVTDLTLSVRSPEIDNGAMIPSTSWSYQSKVSGCIDDLAHKSNGWSAIRQDKHLLFQVRTAQLAPWPLASANTASSPSDLLSYSTPQVTYNSPTYRNRQYVLGGTQTSTIHEQKVGDGVTQSWNVAYPIAANTTPVILVGNGNQVVGLQGATGSFDFTYTTAGVINQNTAYTPPNPGVIVDVTYQGVVPVTVMSESTTQQTAIKAYDGSTGIVEEVETAAGLSQAAAQQLAAARISQYGLPVRDWTFTTRRDGLAPGQILYVFVPEVKLPDVQFLITDVKQTLNDEMGTVRATYEVSCTEGAPAQDWTALFVNQ